MMRSKKVDKNQIIQNKTFKIFLRRARKFVRLDVIRQDKLKLPLPEVNKSQ